MPLPKPQPRLLPWLARLPPRPVQLLLQPQLVRQPVPQVRLRQVPQVLVQLEAPRVAPPVAQAELAAETPEVQTRAARPGADQKNSMAAAMAKARATAKAKAPQMKSMFRKTTSQLRQKRGVTALPYSRYRSSRSLIVAATTPQNELQTSAHSFPS